MENRMNWFYRFFCWVGGGEAQILNDLPTERNRFFGYGSVILMTAIFATLSSTFALSFVMGGLNWLTIIPALLWGAFIFVLDRFFVVSISNSGTFWRKFINAFPRIILAVFIGILISKPLEYKIFEREIKSQLAVTIDEEYIKIDSIYRMRIDSLSVLREIQINKLPGGNILQNNNDNIAKWDTLLKLKEKEVIKQRQSYLDEVTGEGGSRKRGDGPIAAAKKRELLKLERERNNLQNKIDAATNENNEIRRSLKTQIEEEIAIDYMASKEEIRLKRDNDKANLMENSIPSILNQEIALSQIKVAVDKNGEIKYPGAVYAITFVTLLFVFIEMAPMVLKLMSKSGAYERRLAQLESTYSTEGRLRRSLNLEEYKSNKKLMQKLASSQRKIISKALDGWYRQQMEELDENPEYYQEMLVNNGTREENNEYTERENDDHGF